MDLGIKGRTAIVCASSQGLGKACSLALAREGVDVIINGRDANKLSTTADEIRKIVFAFKSNMLPEMLNGRDRDTMTVPNTFNIQYMYKGKENDYVHRISECFLDNVGVTYGGDRYKTFEPHADDGAPPVETAITLSFKEIEIITRERVFEGY